MHVNDINYPAVRALNRALAPKLAVFEEIAEYDRHFDGGEFSGPAIADAEGRLAEEVAARVGARFGISGPVLLEMQWVAEHYEADCFWAAYRPLNPHYPHFS